MWCEIDGALIVGAVGLLFILIGALGSVIIDKLSTIIKLLEYQWEDDAKRGMLLGLIDNHLEKLVKNANKYK